MILCLRPNRSLDIKIKLAPAKDEPDAYARSLAAPLGRVGQINNRLFGLANRDLSPLMCVDFPCHGEQEARNARTGKEF